MTNARRPGTTECPSWLLAILGLLAIPGGLVVMFIGGLLLADLDFAGSERNVGLAGPWQDGPDVTIERLIEEGNYAEALTLLEVQQPMHGETRAKLRARAITGRDGLEAGLACLRTVEGPQVDIDYLVAQLLEEAGEAERARDAYSRYSERAFKFDGSIPTRKTATAGHVDRALRALEQAAWLSADLEQDAAALTHAERAVAVGRNFSVQQGHHCAPSRSGPWGSDVGRLVLARVYARRSNHEMALAQLEWARMAAPDPERLATVESELDRRMGRYGAKTTSIASDI